MTKLAAILGAALLALVVAAVVAVVAVAVVSKSAPQRSSVARAHAVTPAATRSPRLPIPQTRISILSSDVPVSGNVARVRLSCQMGEAIRLTCRGVLSLRGLTGALLASTRFAIPNCCSAPWHVVDLHLGQASRSLPLRARAQAVLNHNAASSTRVVRLVSAG
jgi:hypothetical protein